MPWNYFVLFCLLFCPELIIFPLLCDFTTVKDGSTPQLKYWFWFSRVWSFLHRWFSWEQDIFRLRNQLTTSCKSVSYPMNHLSESRSGILVRMTRSFSLASLQSWRGQKILETQWTRISIPKIPLLPLLSRPSNVTHGYTSIKVVLKHQCWSLIRQVGGHKYIVYIIDVNWFGMTPAIGTFYWLSWPLSLNYTHMSGDQYATTLG